jgi:hypothetical protein
MGDPLVLNNLDSKIAEIALGGGFPPVEAKVEENELSHYFAQRIFLLIHL